MRISYILIAGIRCFENSGRIRLSEGCNIFVGQNNAGKSTILRAALALQGFDFTGDDIRPGARSSFFRVGLTDIKPPDSVPGASSGATDLIVERAFAGSPPEEKIGHRMTSGNPIFQVSRPNHGIVPFLAKRKAPAHDQTVSSAVQGAVTGTYQNLVARIDTLATAGHPRHAKFMTAVADIIGIPITTKAAPNGKRQRSRILSRRQQFRSARTYGRRRNRTRGSHC